MNCIYVDGNVVASLGKLLPKEIPEHLKKKDPVKRKTDFDPNIFFNVLKHLKMNEGYTLDYVYRFIDAFSGNPCLYARGISDKPLSTFEEYKNWTKKNDLYSFITADNTADSFFQLAVFRIMANKYYLYWHANYNDTIIITSSEELESLISEYTASNSSRRFSEEQIAAIRNIHTAPYVTQNDTALNLIYCTFSKWRGFNRIQEILAPYPPYTVKRLLFLGTVKYDCGFIY